jgi:hypothetical protein
LKQSLKHLQIFSETFPKSQLFHIYKHYYFYSILPSTLIATMSTRSRSFGSSIRSRKCFFRTRTTRRSRNRNSPRIGSSVRSVQRSSPPSTRCTSMLTGITWRTSRSSGSSTRSEKCICPNRQILTRSRIKDLLYGMKS